MALLPKSFYTRPDVVRISRELLGKFVFTRVRNRVTGGMIIETEAYAGATDRASHAYGNRRTKRTEVMFHEGGVAYVYFCYGMHSLLNVVTNLEGIPDAVLIRALLPAGGIPLMLRRRGKKCMMPSPQDPLTRPARRRALRNHRNGGTASVPSAAVLSTGKVLRTLAAGPGTLTKALGIDCSFNGRSLAGPAIWIEDRGVKVKASDIVAGPRVGVDYAGADAERPWRFRLNRQP